MKKNPIYPSDLTDQTNVRFPAGMRDHLKGSAKLNGRSMKAEIIARLEASSEPSRDEIAMRALPAIITATSAGQHNVNITSGRPSIQLMAKDAYEIADAMLIARKVVGS